MKKKVKKYFSSVGLKFPENEAELKAFNEIHDEYDHSLSEEDIDPNKILQKIKQEHTLAKKPTRIDYHKRTVLAAEIVFQLKDDVSLGHVKLQKLIFLCQNTSSMSLHTNFLKQAMGPYDPVLMRSIDHQFKKNKWFEYQPTGFIKYQPLKKCGGHQTWFKRYFENDLENINYIIDLLRKASMEQTELVGTIFACWLKGIQENTIISDEYLIKKVYGWHETKKEKYTRDQIISATQWMKEKGIYPSK